MDARSEGETQFAHHAHPYRCIQMELCLLLHELMMAAVERQAFVMTVVPVCPPQHELQCGEVLRHVCGIEVRLCVSDEFAAERIVRLQVVGDRRSRLERIGPVHSIASTVHSHGWTTHHDDIVEP